jgi:hypothetical protein
MEDVKSACWAQCGRTPCDQTPFEELPRICKCQLEELTSKHLLHTCPLIAAEWSNLIASCFGPLTEEGFLFDQRNIGPIIKFMAETTIGYSNNPPERGGTLQTPTASLEIYNDVDNINPFTAGGITLDEGET